MKQVFSWFLVGLGLVGVAVGYWSIHILVAYFAAGVVWWASVLLFAGGPVAWLVAPCRSASPSNGSLPAWGSQVSRFGCFYGFCVSLFLDLSFSRQASNLSLHRAPSVCSLQSWSCLGSPSHRDRPPSPAVPVSSQSVRPTGMFMQEGTLKDASAWMGRSRLGLY